MEEGGNAIVMKNLKEQGWSLWNCALDKKWVEWCDRCREAAEIEYDYLDEHNLLDVVFGTKRDEKRIQLLIEKLQKLCDKKFFNKDIKPGL